MLKQDMFFQWDEIAQNYFMAIKEAIASAPFLQNHIFPKMLLYILMQWKRLFHGFYCRKMSNVNITL